VALAALAAAVREGVDQPEKVALRQVRSRQLNRVAIHREYLSISQYLVPAGPAEIYQDVVDRVRSAVEIYDVLQ
jgi:hypothetical protein